MPATRYGAVAISGERVALEDGVDFDLVAVKAGG